MFSLRQFLRKYDLFCVSVFNSGGKCVDFADVTAMKEGSVVNILHQEAVVNVAGHVIDVDVEKNRA